MRSGARTLLTLEERLELAARSQAVSPEAAAKLVQRFSRLYPMRLFCSCADLDSLYGLTGEFWESIGEDLMHYHGFCRSVEMAIAFDNDFFPMKNSPVEARGPYQPVWGVRTNNAMVLLGLMLLDHAKGGRSPKDVYHCTRMTLEQYLDALVNLSFRKDGSLDRDRAKCFRRWKDTLLKDYDGSKPLEEALADILRRYIAGWQEFDRLEHILHCMDALACHLEKMTGEALPTGKAERVRLSRKALCGHSPGLRNQELAEADQRHRDPGGYYFRLANQYPEDAPDPGSPAIAPGTLRSQLFFSARDYDPQVLRVLAAESPSPDLRALLEKHIDQERLAAAMREINVAVTDLYMLWVEPYVQLEQYHYERHLGGASLD